MTKLIARLFVVVIGLMLGTNEAARAQCPTDNVPCAWKEADPIHLLLTNLDGKKDPNGPPCQRYFDLYVCYRCCSKGGAGMEMKLNYIVPVLDDGTPVKDWTRGCEWSYGPEFWKQVDRGVAHYGLQYGKYECEKGLVSCIAKTLPQCKDGSALICTYFKSNCMRYVPDIRPTDEGNLGWRLVPCDGAGECKQVWEVCCDDLSVNSHRVFAESTGGCYRVGSAVPEPGGCFPTC